MCPGITIGLGLLSLFGLRCFGYCLQCANSSLRNGWALKGAASKSANARVRSVAGASEKLRPYSPSGRVCIVKAQIPSCIEGASIPTEPTTVVSVATCRHNVAEITKWRFRFSSRLVVFRFLQQFSIQAQNPSASSSSKAERLPTF